MSALKRFTETTKWFDPWFMDLSVKHKLFWYYICDQCDGAGIWEPNIKLAQMLIGEPVELVEVLRVFRGRIEQLPNGKFWVKTFVEFQYGVLSPDCKPHLPVIKRLENLGLRKRVSIPFPKGLDTLQEKEKEKEKVQEKEKGSAEGKQKPATPAYPKLPAPIYDKLPPKREPTDQELANAQRIAREEIEKLRQKLGP